MWASLQRFMRRGNLQYVSQLHRRCFSSPNARYQAPLDVSRRKTRPESQRHNGDTNSRRHPEFERCVRYTTSQNQSISYQTPPPPASSSNASGVEIRVDGQSHWFSPILLRDLCGCPQCLDPSTKQKYRPTTDIPTTITPRAMAQTESGVSIAWDNDVSGYGRDHATDISMDVLRDYIYSGVTGIANFTLPPRTLWDVEDYNEVPDMSYQEYMESDPALYTVLNQLHTHGLAFVTNVPESEKSVSAIAERIGPIKNTFYGYTWDVRSVPDSKNVAYTSQDLGFHMDLLYMEQPPHLQFLHCIRSSSAGGASLFTDSHRAAFDLLESNVDAFAALETHSVNFHYNHPSSALYHFQRPVFEIDGEKWNREFSVANPVEYLTNVAWSPPFQAPLGYKPPPNDKKDPLDNTNQRMTEWHTAAQKFNALIHRPEMIYERMMKPGECVLFDNRRVLHARKAFEVGDIGKERWLRGAYLDKDPYLSKMRVLRHQLGKDERVRDQEKELGEYFEAAAAS